ncbi:MAG: hypothetical protein U0L42_03010 [Methanobrevibacter sp.]|uniref:DUF6932 family protein n=1 Tax=Methanobrevibacter sp. TaxID=66852 RepID=UPI002E794A86|nr:hypothetical protein [Methanobrevibacter sp.]MEE0934620.1 hypothetical protein [Methanobrevibacter sp.]
MNLKYTEEGCLSHGIYELSLAEVENEFVKGKSQRRKDIFDCYKFHLAEIKATGCCLNHWIDGSFVTLKENPNDIDTLTEFDGQKVDNLGIKDVIDRIIFDAPLKTGGYCHSFLIYKFPKYRKQDYEEYLKYKSTVLFVLFSGIKDSKNSKGFIKLNGDT